MTDNIEIDRENTPDLTRVRAYLSSSYREAQRGIEMEIQRAGFTHYAPRPWVLVSCDMRSDGTSSPSLQVEFSITPISACLSPTVALEYAAELARANLFVANLMSETNRWRWRGPDYVGEEIVR